jgi:hypothetical protein
VRDPDIHMPVQLTARIAQGIRADCGLSVRTATNPNGPAIAAQTPNPFASNIVPLARPSEAQNAVLRKERSTTP